MILITTYGVLAVGRLDERRNVRGGSSVRAIYIVSAAVHAESGETLAIDADARVIDLLDVGRRWRHLRILNRKWRHVGERPTAQEAIVDKRAGK